MKSIAALALIGAVSSVELNQLNNQHKMYVAMQLEDDTLV
jgi:hypothetical protein